MNIVVNEAASWLDSIQSDVPADPVFDGIVREFLQFDSALDSIYSGVEQFMQGVDSLCFGILVLSQSLVGAMTRKTDGQIASDTCRFREVTNQVARADAPHSALAKLIRDMDYNVMSPLRRHLANNKQLKAALELRKRRLSEFVHAQRKLEQYQASRNTRNSGSAETAYKNAKDRFKEVDRPTFEWLMMLETYKCDLYDSILQTIKYLQYEFFAASAHSISSALPKVMEFRPIVEMTPDQLLRQVEMQIAESAEADDTGVEADATLRILERWEREGAFSDCIETTAPVDNLSLSVLMSQGFEEGPARKALRLHNNDTQAALDWLLNGAEEQPKETNASNVRMPTTVKWMKTVEQTRMKERAERKKREEKERHHKHIQESGATPGESNKKSHEAEPRRHSKTAPKKKNSLPKKPSVGNVAATHKQKAQGSTEKEKVCNSDIDIFQQAFGLDATDDVAEQGLNTKNVENRNHDSAVKQNLMDDVEKQNLLDLENESSDIIGVSSTLSPLPDLMNGVSLEPPAALSTQINNAFETKPDVAAHSSLYRSMPSSWAVTQGAINNPDLIQTTLEQLKSALSNQVPPNGMPGMVNNDTVNNLTLALALQNQIYTQNLMASQRLQPGQQPPVNMGVDLSTPQYPYQHLGIQPAALHVQSVNQQSVSTPSTSPIDSIKSALDKLANETAAASQLPDAKDTFSDLIQAAGHKLREKESMH